MGARGDEGARPFAGAQGQGPETGLQQPTRPAVPRVSAQGRGRPAQCSSLRGMWCPTARAASTLSSTRTQMDKECPRGTEHPSYPPGTSTGGPNTDTKKLKTHSWPDAQAAGGEAKGGRRTEHRGGAEKPRGSRPRLASSASVSTSVDSPLCFEQREVHALPACKVVAHAVTRHRAVPSSLPSNTLLDSQQTVRKALVSSPAPTPQVLREALGGAKPHSARGTPAARPESPDYVPISSREPSRAALGRTRPLPTKERVTYRVGRTK